MTTNTLHADLLAAQSEMPALQKSGINPHFKNRFVPLDEVLTKVIPILNKYGFVLLQMPSIANGEPALTYRLLHASGESIEGTMALLCGKDDPQGQGSAITYARRYSLMALLGLTADADDDGDSTRMPARKAPNGQAPQTASENQAKMAFALWKQCTTDAQFAIYQYMSKNLPHAITEGDGQPHWNRLTRQEASTIIDQLTKAPKAEVPV